MIDKKSILNLEKTEIEIDKNYWADLQKKYTKEEIKQAISETIEEFNLKMPLNKLTFEEAESSFIELLNLNTLTMIKSGDIFTRYEYKHDMSHYYIEQIKTGNNSSNYFQQYNRFLCDSINAPSPYRSWYISKFRQGILNALFTLKFKEINNTKLRSAISLRKYIASQFKPSVAKCIYELFDAKNVLDFSSGWGDRLAGFYSASNTQSYTGIDPNERVYNEYSKQINLYEKYTKKEVSFINLPAEEVNFDLLNKNFDFIFTSPPYFNVERYTQESNQSWKKFKKLDSWLENFLFNVLEKSWNALEEGGILAINISDVYSGHRINKICDPMNDFLLTLPNSNYMGCLGMKMSKRPNNKTTQRNGIFIEPIWIFSKGKNITLDEYIKNKKI